MRVYRKSLTILTLAALAAVAAGCGGGSPFTAPELPDITLVTPASGGVAGGTSLVLEGTLLANSGPGVLTLTFGGAPAQDVVVESATRITCTTPPGTLGAADIEITNQHGAATLAGGYTYFAPPTLTNITPVAGTKDGGVPVTLTGTGFADNNPGDPTVTVGLKEMTDVVAVNDTTITAVMPSSWLEVPKDVSVMNLNGTATLTAAFTYVGPLPIISSISPTLGPRTGGTLCTIVGDNFTISGGSLDVRFGSVLATGTNRVDDQTLTCFSPPGAAGLTNVEVGNSNGWSLPLINAFFYIPAPAVISVTPNTGSMAGGETVTILGEGFAAPGAGTNAVMFGANPATNVVVGNDTTITCTAPPSSVLGAVAVSITNGNGFDSLLLAYTYTAPCSWHTDFGSNLGLSDDSSSFRTFGFTFPFYGTGQTGCYVVSNGDLQFGGVNQYNYGGALQTRPEIGCLMRDLNPSSGGGVYAKTATNRFVVTWENVPEYPANGSNTCQIHLLNDGTVCMMWKAVSMSPMVCVNPGTASGASVDLSAGFTGGTSTQAVYENFGSFDLTNSTVIFNPNASGGYDVIHLPFIP